MSSVRPILNVFATSHVRAVADLRASLLADPT